MTRLQHILLGLMLTICCSQGMEYILPFLYGEREVTAVAGEKGGWYEVQSTSEVNLEAYELSILSWSGFGKRTGIEKNTVLVKANNLQIYSFTLANSYSPLPISALGTKYIVSFCVPPGINNYISSIVITTHSYKTDVNITFRLEGHVTYDNRTYTNGDTLTVSLQEYQTLKIISDWDLSGTVVRSSQTVAVFSAMCDRFNRPYAFGQLLPVQLYGQEYVVAVDDNPSPYQIQIVSEASNTRITFNNGSTVTMDESGIFKQNITSNTTLYFSSSKPVMTMLCRHNIVVLPPVSVYTKKTPVYVSFEAHTLKILTDKQASDIAVKTNSTESFLFEWEEIPGSRFKVGTAVITSNFITASISSSMSFAVLVFDLYNMYTGGYNFSQPTRRIGVEYIIPKIDIYETILASAGETGGWCEVQSISKMNVKTYEFSTSRVSGFAKKWTGFEKNAGLVKANNVEIYSSTGSSVYSPLPISALGTKYIVSFCILPTVRNYSSSIMITTHSHKTDVNITFRLEGNVTYDNGIYTDGDTLTVSLQEYQTLTIISDWDLSGTVVTSSRNVAVFSVMYGRYNEPRTVSQLLPVQLYGQEYVVAVDDNPSVYQIQIVSEASNTRITFNDGSTVTMDESGIFKQNITRNTTLHFSSSRPVMTMLCRLDDMVVLPPVSVYTKQISVLLGYKTDTVKILTEKQASDIAVKFNSPEILLLEWEEIPGSRYKVGTAVTPYSWTTASITSNTSFAVLVFNPYNMYTGGYNFSQTTREIGMLS